MDRIIQPYPDPHPGPRDAPAVAPMAAATATELPKSPGDFARALRRRAWLALLVALTVIVPGAVLVLRQPNVYRVTAQIEISPPKFDPILVTFVGNGQIAGGDRESVDKYVPNHLALLQSRSLAAKVIADPAVGASPAFTVDPEAEILGALRANRIPGTNIFDVHLEGRDPERIARILNTLIEQFKFRTRDESVGTIQESQAYVQNSIRNLHDAQPGGLKAVEAALDQIIREDPIIGPNGKNLVEEQYELMSSILVQRRFRFDDLIQEERIARFHPGLRGQAAPSPKEQQLEKLLQYKEYLTEQAVEVRRLTKNFNGDPAARRVTTRLQKTMDEIERLQGDPTFNVPDLTKLTLDHASEQIDKVQGEVRKLMVQLKESMRNYQTYTDLVEQREGLKAEIASMESKLRNFNMLVKTRTEPVRTTQSATEPTTPIGPPRTLYTAMVVVLGLGLGVGLVFLLEWLDRRVKVPEHLVAGLSLPLFAVIPRIPRLAGTHRGGHLWAPGAPTSTAADAYRNLRASLLGIHGAKGPVVTLLVTSAKAGEGKSTTALNLAATCARAGERTLLMDVDLRRPSLGEVFEEDGHDVGLVDCLRGHLPWQRVVVRTDVPNLDFLPTGDPADTPIEVLGSLEFRQLILALSGHYDRVILDAPAVLGMADCRMMGRIVDAAILVVRSGAHELRPLRRAKAMLEQSKVALAGVVFNGIHDDLENWSSYGYEAATANGSLDSPSRPDRGLNAPDRASD